MVRLLPSVTKVDRLFPSTRPRAHLFTQRNETTMRRRGTIRLGLTALAASALLVLPQMAQAAPSEEEIAAVLARTGKTAPEDRLNCGACGYPTCRDKAIAVLQGKADVEMCLPYMREKAESTSNLMMEYAPNAILLLSPEGKLVEYNPKARAMLGIRGRAGCGRDVGQYLAGGLPDLTQGAVLDVPCQLAENDKQVRLSAVATPAGDVIVVLRDVTQEEQNRTQFERARAQTLQMAQQAVDRQMRMVQQVAQLLGETTGETKAALLRMERSIAQEEGR